jgi:hypothetical protein
MSVTTGPVGLETRKSILPKPNIPDKVPGILGPDYSGADNVPLPGQVGIHTGDSINSVVDAVKGTAYYIDLIGFGESTNSLTSGLGVKRLGVNTFMRTGFKCANGADMWMYNEGIPNGSALGKRLSDGLASAGLPQLRGIAPGILEDAQNALDPRPVMQTVFGTGYPNCKLVTLRVGDQDGNIQNSSTGAYFVENPESVFPGPDGFPAQKRWVYDRDLTNEQYDAVQKTHCPDGISKANHRDTDCLKQVLSQGFQDYDDGRERMIEQLRILGIAAGVLVGVVLLHKFMRGKK